MQKIRKNRSDDRWVERLYKEDPQKRKLEKEYVANMYKPSFKPSLLGNIKSKINKKIEKESKVNDILDQYHEKQNPELLIEYLSKNNQEKDEKENDVFRQKLFDRIISEQIQINNH